MITTHDNNIIKYSVYHVIRLLMGSDKKKEHIYYSGME